MAEARVQRKLAAILAADVVGYSRLMGADEEATLHTLREYREIIDDLIAHHQGRLFGSAGDSLIAEFASPVEAVRCATEIQLELGQRNGELPADRQMHFRIGVNLGDVMVEEDDLFGDGVNVAARLEGLARAGGLCVSDTVVSHVRDRLGLEFEDLGVHEVKNIAHPVRVFRVPLASEFLERSPFRGLDVFEYEHADLFHGRANAVAMTMDRLKQQAASGTAFLVIYGMSGSGKSSLARAGLLPAITKPGAVSGVDAWRICVFRPSEGKNPIAALVDALLDVHALPELDAASVDTGGVERRFQGRPEIAVAAVEAAIKLAAPGDGEDTLKLTVVVDQLEELFTAEEIGTEQREAFIALLGALARSGHVWVIATIRTDFLHRCASVPGLSALKDGLGSYELLPPTAPEIAQIIRKPARLAGLRFEESQEVGRLEDVLQEAAANDPASLPLLEFVLDELYELGRARRVLTFADYRALGGLEGAIARRADAVIGALPAAVQVALPAVLRALTTVRLRDESVTARATARAEVAATPDQAALVESLVEARLLVSDEGVIRLVHEALLSHWPRARDIVAANLEFLETRARVQTDARRWLAEERNPDLLLPSGKRLAEAEDLLDERRAELDDELVAYVAKSSEAARTRREEEESARRERLELEAEAAREREAAARKFARRTRIAAAIALFLAFAASIGALIGYSGQQEATRQAIVAVQSAEQARAAEREAELQAEQARKARDEALAASNRALQQVRSLIASGVDLDEGKILHDAAVNGHEAIVELLLESGTNPNAVARDGSVPLHWAALNGNTEVAALLLESGAEPEAQSFAFGAPMHMAAENGHVAIIELLIAHGANPDIRKSSSQMVAPLHFAAKAGHLQVAELLIKGGADVNAGDASNDTPLHRAAQAGSLQMTELLIELGADVNAAGWSRITPLHWAAERGNGELVEILIAAGADIGARSTDVRNGGTAMDWAIRLGYEDIAELLQRHGATSTRQTQ